MSELDDFRSGILAKQAEAEVAFHEGDPEPRMALWSRKDPVTLFGARGMYRSGRGEVSETFREVASTFSDVTDYEYEVKIAHVEGDMAYTLGYERYNGSIAGGPVKPVVLRVTHVYRREDGEWKIVHRHGDHPPEN